MKQKRLPLSAPRVALLENEEDRKFGQPHHGHGIEEEEELRVRLPKGAAAAVAAADPKEVERMLAANAREMLNEMCTPWSTVQPPCTGLWLVTDHKTGTKAEFWWFSNAIAPVWSNKAPGTPSKSSTIMAHSAFALTYAWRGLKERPRQPYPCPPYSTSELPQGAHTLMNPSLDPHKALIPPRVEAGWISTDDPIKSFVKAGLYEVVLKNPDGKESHRGEHFFTGTEFEDGLTIGQFRTSFNAAMRRIGDERKEKAGSWLILGQKGVKPALTTGLHEIVCKDREARVLLHMRAWWNGKSFDQPPGFGTTPLDLEAFDAYFYAAARRIPGGKGDARIITVRFPEKPSRVALDD